MNSSLAVAPPYALDQQQKTMFLTEHLRALTAHHYEACEPYRRMMDAIALDLCKLTSYKELPFIPTSLFKTMDLASVIPDSGLSGGIRLTSSATTGAAVSKIYVDAETSKRQRAALIEIVSHWIGKQRLPLLIIDSAATIRDQQHIQARAAGIHGFSLFARVREFALREAEHKQQLTLDVEAVTDFLAKHGQRPFLIFGFTFLVWQHLYRESQQLGLHLDLTQGILIHGGGWKSMAAQAVTRAHFQRCLQESFGLQRVHDYYGMAEQAGSIHVECEYGHLHASVYSDVLVRRARDLTLCELGEPGIVQVVSVLPKSYCGHSLLTEDEGVLLGVDDCPCGRLGTYFHILGRLPQAELRGCSDTYGSNYEWRGLV